LKNLKATSNI